MAADGWIRCDAELPPVGELVLFAEVDPRGNYVRVGRYEGDGWWEPSGHPPRLPIVMRRLPTLLDYDYGCGVSHWRHLPELPPELRDD